MIRRPFLRRAATAAALTLALAAPAGAGVRVAAQPESLVVAPGDTFTVWLRVPETGSRFNGFDATLTFDPAALAFVPTSPLSAQEGADMKAACANRFHRFTATADSLTAVDVLLCAGVTVSGPATLYQVRFRAIGTPQVTAVRLRGVHFYDDGLYVEPVTTSDALIGIGVPITAVASPPPPRAPRVRAHPNPARAGTTLELELPEACALEVCVVDVLGRAVRHLERARAEPGARRVTWDGRDDAGRPVAPGLYRGLVRAGAREAGVALVVLR
jgi:hypothetical protein